MFVAKKTSHPTISAPPHSSTEVEEARGEPGQPAGGLVQVNFGEPGEVRVCRYPPSMPVVGDRRSACEAALKLEEMGREGDLTQAEFASAELDREIAHLTRALAEYREAAEV